MTPELITNLGQALTDLGNHLNHPQITPTLIQTGTELINAGHLHGLSEPLTDPVS